MQRSYPMGRFKGIGWKVSRLWTRAGASAESNFSLVWEAEVWMTILLNDEQSRLVNEVVKAGGRVRPKKRLIKRFERCMRSPWASGRFISRSTIWRTFLHGLRFAG